MKIFLIFFLLLLGYAEGKESWPINSNGNIFLPTHLQHQIEDLYSFPVSWWNFIVIEYELGQPIPFEEVDKLCQKLKLLVNKQDLSVVQCSSDLSPYIPLLKEWAYDLPLRRPPPSKEEQKAIIGKALALLSLPAGEEGAGLLSLMRFDPLGSYQDFLQLLEKKKIFSLQRQRGVLIDTEKAIIVIPLLFRHSPERTETAQKVISLLPQQTAFLGPHASHLENKQQVMRDLETTSLWGGPLFLLFFLFLLLSKGWKALLLVPPLIISTLTSIVATVVVFGSVHGLTLSFGITLIGISIDYGLHTLLMKQEDTPRAWTANLAGLLTTLVVFITFSFGQIPLIRQIMFFSTVGLTTAFLCYRIMSSKLKSSFYLTPYQQTFTFSWIKGAIGFSLLLALPFLFFLPQHFDFSMRKFDYKTSFEQGLETKLYSTMGKSAPILAIDRFSHREEALAKTSEYEKAAQELSINSETIKTYLKSEQESENYLKAWREQQKEFLTFFEHNKNLMTLFSPFISSLNKRLSADFKESPSQNYPSYISHLISTKDPQKIVSFWYPKDEQSAKALKARFPHAVVIKEVVAQFPQILIKELSVMAPITLLSVALILFLIYQNVQVLLLALVPCFTALSLLLLSHSFFGWPITFVNIMTFLMIYGLSVDYGIFAYQSVLPSATKSYQQGAWSSLILASTTTITGLIPLLFCKHPVLLQMGQTATIGMIGTMIGALWCLPFCFKMMVLLKERGQK